MFIDTTTETGKLNNISIDFLDKLENKRKEDIQLIKSYHTSQQLAVK